MIKQITVVKFECFVDRPVSTCTLFNIEPASLTLKYGYSRVLNSTLKQIFPASVGITRMSVLATIT